MGLGGGQCRSALNAEKWHSVWNSLAQEVTIDMSLECFKKLQQMHGQVQPHI